jgi:hypothetical protein
VRDEMKMEVTHWNTVGVLLADTLSLCFALLKGVLVFEFGPHFRKGREGPLAVVSSGWDVKGYGSWKGRGRYL